MEHQKENGSHSSQSSGRIFIGIPFSPEARATLLSSLRSVWLPGHVTPPEKWHITLCFCGEPKESTVHELYHVLSNLSYPPPFMLRLDSLGAFPKVSRPRVLWLGSQIESAPMIRLAELVQSAAGRCGIPLEERKFSLHITLSRLKVTQDLRRLITDLSGKIAVELLVNRMTLFRSHLGAFGSAKPFSYYEILGEFPFEHSN